MQYSRIAFLFLLTVIFVSCENENNNASKSDASYGNIAAVGFNEKKSDPKAISIADEVMTAMGGREAWDETRYLRWNFFGSRLHTWDKQTGDLIIKGLRDTFDIRMNIHNNTGSVNYKGVNLTAQDSLQKYLDKGKSMWINDAYWLFMPHKLKDSGVTLKYITKDTTSSGRSADVLSLTFDQVGDTPDNMYYVYVDDSSRLVTQWDFYTDVQDSIARFTTPWNEYEQYDRLLLSSSRGENYDINDISASDTLSRYFE